MKHQDPQKAPAGPFVTALNAQRAAEWVPPLSAANYANSGGGSVLTTGYSYSGETLPGTSYTASALMSR